MPCNATECSDCESFAELRDPQPGCSWNRCSRIEVRTESEYPCPLNCFGYAEKKCEFYKKSNLSETERTNLAIAKYKEDNL